MLTTVMRIPPPPLRFSFLIDPGENSYVEKYDAVIAPFPVCLLCVDS